MTHRLNNQTTISILGAGWLGLPFGKKLVELGYLVKGSSTNAKKLAKIEAAGINGFLLKVDEGIQGDNREDFFACDLLFINIPPRRSNPNIIYDYPQQIDTILRKAEQQQVPKCIFISSTGVYSDHNQIAREEELLHPEKNSGKALVKAEALVRQTKNIQSTILRLAGLTGPGREPGRFLAGKRNLSNGEAPVNLVHLDDCIGILIEIIKQDKFGEVFNVCADEHPLRKDFYPMQAQKLGLVSPTFLENEKADFKIVSNKKVKEDLGYTFIWPDPMQF